MAQQSGPIAKGTDAERQFTDVLWRNLFGAEAGIVGDLNGTAYQIGLPPDSDVAQIGSATQDSISRVAGFAHIIPAGQPEGITIPAAAAERTDLIVARYTPDTVGLPGPVRLALIEGTSGGLPVHDDAPPGTEDMPLWAVTRKPSQALSQATVRDLRRRVSLSRTLPDGAPLPSSSPLDTIVHQAANTYRRELDPSGIPAWVPPGRWQTYTPVWSTVGGSQPTIGNGVLAGRYVRLNRHTGLLKIQLTLGTTTGGGSAPSSAAYQFTLPPGWVNGPMSSALTGYFKGSGDSGGLAAFLSSGDSKLLELRASQNNALVGNGLLTAVGDYIIVSGLVELA